MPLDFRPGDGIPSWRPAFGPWRCVLDPKRCSSPASWSLRAPRTSLLFGSSPCLRPDLSLSAVGPYALSTVVFISKTVRHALNQLDLVVKAFCDPVAVTIADVVDNGLKPTCQRPSHPLQRLLDALAGTLNQLRERLAGWFFILALEPQAQVLHPVNHLAQLRKAPSP